MAGEDSNVQATQQSKRGRRIIIALIIGLVLIATPLVTWFTLDFSKKPSKTESKAIKKSDVPELGAPPRLPIPLVSTQVVLIRKNVSKGIPAFVVPTNTPPVKPIDKMIVRLADSTTNQAHHAVVQVFLVANNTDALIYKINKNQPQLYRAVQNRLATKTMNDAQTPGFRDIVRSELVQVCNRILGPNAVQEVVITDFVTQ